MARAKAPAAQVPEVRDFRVEVECLSQSRGAAWGTFVGPSGFRYEFGRRVFEKGYHGLRWWELTEEYAEQLRREFGVAS